MAMKKLIFLKMILILLAFTTQAQVIQNDVIGTAGGVDTIGQFLVSWTAGETITEKISDPDCIATQGFQQTFFTITAISETCSALYEVVCYPNPTLKEIHVRIVSIKPNETFDIRLMDIHGKLLLKKETQSAKVETIDLSVFTSSVFFLHVVQQTQNKGQVFKIIKQNHH
jgi:hypothetical protein